MEDAICCIKFESIGLKLRKFYVNMNSMISLKLYKSEILGFVEIKKQIFVSVDVR